MYGSFDRLSVSYGFYASRALVSYFAIINDSLRHSGNLGVRIIMAGKFLRISSEYHSLMGGNLQYLNKFLNICLMFCWIFIFLAKRFKRLAQLWLHSKLAIIVSSWESFQTFLNDKKSAEELENPWCWRIFFKYIAMWNFYCRKISF